MAELSKEYKEKLSRAMNLCSKQEKCLSDIRNKLSEWGADQADSEKILKQLVQDNFIDETRYAGSFTKHKFSINKWGKIKIKYQLQRKKIKEEDIEQALDLVGDEEYLESLTLLLSAKRKSLKGKNLFDLKSKLTRYAYGKGFEYEHINRVLDIILE